ncbi:TauD/TfdA family dioxygenase [Cryptosporangium arvum]|uniref:Taurine catabolism dioxygenase TauD, TfdA family n=1 Tax=Cryptosporangium arvum DSM 44712 TaxID=927661 RepID=A0A010ZWK8_9ACTN|nr:TauD/TfdA family dioxygenase [Cryptosporangium arvum]EXG81607.1 Taurine catabolism dioxygenase TauD, TfdA family [Cryptosporangium arvum DSM 44712]
MASTTLSPVTGPSAWRGDQLQHDRSWIYHLTEEQIAELEAVGRKFVLDDPDLRTVTREDYPLPVCAPAIEQWGHDMSRGRGFVLIRGLQTELYSDALSGAIFYLTGLHLGSPMQQNGMGDLIDHVVATSDKTMDDPTARSSRVRDKLVFHSDSSDAVALFCLRPAKQGGASSLVSGAQIYNEIVARRPDLAPLLLEPVHFDWRRQDSNAPSNTYVSPIVSIVDGVCSIYAGSTYILTAQNYPEVPKLTPEQLEVIAMFDAITYEPGMALDMDFQPGDIQWVSNFAALHSRTEFTDHPEWQRRRHLLRLWDERDRDRPRVPNFGKPVVARDQKREDDLAAIPDVGQFSVKTAVIPRPVA